MVDQPEHRQFSDDIYRSHQRLHEDDRDHERREEGQKIQRHPGDKGSHILREGAHAQGTVDRLIVVVHEHVFYKLRHRRILDLADLNIPPG